jgi:hypothetical protein
MIAALCLAAGAMNVKIPATHFTLRWQHSIEKIEWDEDYAITGNWLMLSGARIRGSGAGMEPPPDAHLDDKGVYHYTLADPWRKEIVLARSGFVRDYDLCVDNKPCKPLWKWIPESAGPTTATACTAPG